MDVWTLLSMVTQYLLQGSVDTVVTVRSSPRALTTGTALPSLTHYSLPRAVNIFLCLGLQKLLAHYLLPANIPSDLLAL